MLQRLLTSSLRDPKAQFANHCFKSVLVSVKSLLHIDKIIEKKQGVSLRLNVLISVTKLFNKQKER